MADLTIPPTNSGYRFRRLNMPYASLSAAPSHRRAPERHHAATCPDFRPFRPRQLPRMRPTS